MSTRKKPDSGEVAGDPNGKKKTASRAGAAAAYVALAAFLAAPAAQGSTGDPSTFADRIASAKKALIDSGSAAGVATKLAQWLNVGIPVAPWGNWNNWHNWHNWRNWGNWHGGWFNL